MTDPITAPEALATKLAKLETLADQAESIFKNCLVASGTCCCGEDMAHHSQYSGHPPNDIGEFQALLWLMDYAALKEDFE